MRAPGKSGHTRHRNRDGLPVPRGLNSQRAFGSSAEHRRKSRPRSAVFHGSSPCKRHRISSLRLITETAKRPWRSPPSLGRASRGRISSQIRGSLTIFQVLHKQHVKSSSGQRIAHRCVRGTIFLILNSAGGNGYRLGPLAGAPVTARSPRSSACTSCRCHTDRAHCDRPWPCGRALVPRRRAPSAPWRSTGRCGRTRRPLGGSRGSWWPRPPGLFLPGVLGHEGLGERA